MTNLNNKLLSYSIKGFKGEEVGSNLDSVAKFENIISAILGFLTVIGVVFFVVQIILAGFTLISSKGDPKQFQAAQSKLIHNLIGLLIVVVAFGVTVFLTSLLGLGDIFDLTNSLKPNP